jgi:hypothetical protein
MPFDINLIYEAQEVLLADGTVLADIDVFPRYGGLAVEIYGWSSYDPGKGNTNKALDEIRVQADWISVCGIGMAHEPDTHHWQYWQHQYNAGRVDELWDDEGNIVAKRGE